MNQSTPTSFVGQAFVDFIGKHPWVTLLIGLVVLGLTGSIILMIAGLFPGLSLITVPVNFFIWTPMILIFDLCDSVFVRRNLDFSQRKQKVFGHFFASVSVGLIAFMLISIPFLNLIGLPVAVCMGTLHAHKLCDNL